MDLFFDPGRTNTLRERTTGILSDLLSEVIERVRGKTGEDMLSVAEGLNVNRHNALLHSIPLKEGVKDVCAAIKEHAASRKRKRTSGPSESDSSNHGSDEDLSSGSIANGHFTPVDESSMNSSEMSEHYSPMDEKEGLSHELELNSASSSNTNEHMFQSTEQSHTENKCNQKVRFEPSVSQSNQTKPESELPPLSDITSNPPPKLSVRTSSRRAKLDAKKEAKKPPEPAPPPPPTPPVQTLPQKRQTETKQKKKRKSMKDLHKKCNKQYIKLAEVMLTDVPLLLDGDSEDENQELVTLIKSECPENWSVGKPRTPSFRKKYFCRKCTVGDQL